jgi:hypothetical protein
MNGKLKGKLSGTLPDERNRLLCLESKIKILSTFSDPHTFTQALEELKISQTTLTKYLIASVGEGLLEHDGKTYRTTDKGKEELTNLKTHVQALQPFTQTKVLNLFRHRRIVPSSGTVQKTRYASFIDAWADSQTKIPQATVDNLMKGVAKTVVDSMPLKGLGTMKVSLEITWLMMPKRKPSK